jgi:hypothetical protein
MAFALEMWGGALTRKNRCDLALVRQLLGSSEIRTQLGPPASEWGEALWWSGDKAAAQKQFTVAGTLGLTPSEKFERARVSHG